jgi:hypothetical protein
MSYKQSTRMDVDGSNARKARMWKIPSEVAERIVARAEGDDHKGMVVTPGEQPELDLAQVRPPIYEMRGVAHLPPETVEEDL